MDVCAVGGDAEKRDVDVDVDRQHLYLTIAKNQQRMTGWLAI